MIPNKLPLAEKKLIRAERLRIIKEIGDGKPISEYMQAINACDSATRELIGKCGFTPKDPRKDGRKHDLELMQKMSDERPHTVREYVEAVGKSDACVRKTISMHGFRVEREYQKGNNDVYYTLSKIDEIKSPATTIKQYCEHTGLSAQYIRNIIRQYGIPFAKPEQKETLCLTCHRKKCKWLLHGKEIEGWTAEKAQIKFGKSFEDTYIVKECPGFKAERPEKANFRKLMQAVFATMKEDKHYRTLKADKRTCNIIKAYMTLERFYNLFHMDVVETNTLKGFRVVA